MYSCPECGHAVTLDFNIFPSHWCTESACALSKISSSEPWFETLLPDNAQSTDDYAETNQATEKAYQLYSKFYSFFALLAYWIIWRGDLRKHISFFREILNAEAQSENNLEIVDIATGEGSLTEIALFKGKSKKAKRVVVLDLSRSMLRKAATRFRNRIQNKDVILIRGDAMKLPFRDESIQTMSCFGGLNSFPDFEGALSQMIKKLATGGVLRGSFLLFPESPWRQRQILKWLEKGYQTTVMNPSETKEKLEKVVKNTTSKISQWVLVGDVLLFEIRKTLVC